MPELHAIVAVSQNGIIGHEGKLPWRVADDIRHFQNTVRDKLCIVGRKTYLGLPVKVKQHSWWIVLSSPVNYPSHSQVNAKWVKSIADVMSVAMQIHQTMCDPASNIYVAGGAQVYQSFLPICQELIVTEVQASVVGDARFYVPPHFHEVDRFPLALSPGDTAGARVVRYRS